MSSYTANSQALIFALILPSTLCSISHAQTKPIVEEVVVTAQKREQSLQDVPLSVSVFDGESLLDAGVSDLQSLETVEPTISIRASTDESRGASIRIRGVGTSGNNPGLEGSVGVFLDDVYLSRSGIAMNDLVDIEKIEVLRGPQGTLFGKNTSSGALVITTKKPEFEVGGKIRASYGSYDSFTTSGTLTGPLLDNRVAGRISFSHNQADGQIEDLNTGKEFNNRDRQTLRGQLLVTPQDSLEVRLIGDIGKKDERCCASPYSTHGPRQTNIEQSGGTTTSSDPFDREIAINGDHLNSTDEHGISADVRWNQGDFQLTSISSYRSYEYEIVTDGDRSDVDIVNTNVDTEIDTYTQEFRIQHTTESVDWMAGVYLFSEDILDMSQSLYGADTGNYFASFTPNPDAQQMIRDSYIEGEGALSNKLEQEATGWSIFTHNRFIVSENLDIDFGVRYNEEKKEGGGTFVSQSTSLCQQTGGLRSLAIICPVPDFNTDVDYEAVTGTLKFSYALSDSMRIFGGYSRGFKSGGINLNRAAGSSNFEFDPETADSFEVGGKFELFDRRVRLNVTGYLAKFDDYQLNTFDGTTTIVSNEAGVKSEGFEIDILAALTQGLFLTGGVAYNDSYYTDDTVDPNLAGKQLSNAPKWTATTGLSYQHQLGASMKLIGDLNVRYQEGVNTGSDLAPEKYQSDYAVVNMQIGAGNIDDEWKVIFWGRNIFDKDYYAVVIDAPGQAGSYHAFLGAPAMFGVSLEFSL